MLRILEQGSKPGTSLRFMVGFAISWAQTAPTVIKLHPVPHTDTFANRISEISVEKTEIDIYILR